MRRHGWLIYLVVACASVIGYFGLPTADMQDLAFVLVGLVGTVGVAVGIWWHRPGVRLPWRFFLAGLASYTFAQVSYAYQQIALGLVAPFPSPVDAFLLLYFCLMAAGLIVGTRRRLPGRDTASLLDAMLLATAAGAAAWLVLAPWFTAEGVPPLAQTSALLFPVVSILLFGLAARLLLSGGFRIPAIRLVVTALVVQLLGYMLYASSTLRGSYRTGSLIDALLLLSPLLWASAALHPSMTQLTARAHVQLQRYSGRRLVILTVAVFALPAAVGALALLDWPLVLAPVVVSSGLVPLLVVARMALAMRDAQASEVRLAHAQSAQALGRLAGGIAHDFNNLLTAALGHTEIARTSLDDPQARHHLEQAILTQRRAADLVGQLLIFSRGDIPRPGVTELNDVVESMRLLLDRVIGEDIVLRTRTCEDRVHVPLDRTAAEQIVVNLALNARDAMPDGGELTIATDRLGPEVTDVHGHAVRLSVADTGIGMDEVTATHMFDPFFTTKGEDGTGLGLSTVHGIVAGAGGDVRVESRTGAGTTIEILLPAVDPPRPAGASPAPEAAKPTRPRAGSRTVLVVDDQASIRAVVVEILTREGYEVLQAADGVEALVRLEEQDGRVDLLITDVVMPRLGGAELADEVRERSPGTRVLYISGYSREGEVPHGSSESAFLQKPFSISQLLETVDALCANVVETKSG